MPRRAASSREIEVVMRPAPSAQLLCFMVLLLLLWGCSDEKTRLPFATTETPSSIVDGPTPIFHTIIQQAKTPTTVVADVSGDNGITFVRATQAQGQPNSTIVLSRPEGERFNFFWDPLADLGPGLHRDVVFRVFGFGDGSIPGDTAPFVVDLTDRLIQDSSLSALSVDGAVALTLLDGSVVVAGGLSNTSASSQVRRYQPDLDQVATLPSLSVGRSEIAAARLSDGSLLFAGGTSVSALSAAVDRLRVDASGTLSMQSVASLAAPRSQAVVATLADGRALVLGGRDVSGNAVTGVELVSPGTGTGTGTTTQVYTSALGARIAATATRVGDGRTVIIGGSDATGTRRDTALVSGTTGATAAGLSAGGLLLTARAEHAAILLPDGRVFVAGGTSVLGDNVGALSSVEIYDPVTNTAVSAAPMKRTRRRLALAYTDGAVLAIGGTGNSTDAATTLERYEFETNTWTDIAAATGTARGRAAASTFGPGFVLVTGGSKPAERYYPDADPSAISFELLEARIPPRADHTATGLFDGRVLIVGGTSQITSATSSVQLFDPFDDTFSDRAPLARARARHAAVVAPDGRVLVAGGADQNGLVSEAEAYSFNQNSWESAGTLVVPRRDPTLTVFSTSGFARVFVIGGTDAAGAPVSAVEEWDPVGKRFSNVSGLSEGRTNHRAISTLTRLFVGPGTGPSGAQNTGVVFDSAGAIVETPTLRFARSGAALSFQSSLRRLLVSGGSDATGPRRDAEVLDVDQPQSQLLSSIPDLVVARTRHEVADLSNSRVLIVGGRGTSGLALDEGEVFTFLIQSFGSLSGSQGAFARTSDRTMNRARERFSATSLPDGRVLILGGVDERGACIAGAELFVP
jgi:hypothetical protein